MKNNLIEMEGFLRGKCLPGDMKVNETNAEYLVRKFNELESKLEESQREFRSADITMQNLEAKCEKLAAENAKLADCANFYRLGFKPVKGAFGIEYRPTEQLLDDCGNTALEAIETPATDSFLAEVRAQGVDEIAELFLTLASHEANRIIAESWRESARFAKDHAAQLRKGVRS